MHSFWRARGPGSLRKIVRNNQVKDICSNLRKNEEPPVPYALTIFHAYKTSKMVALFPFWLVCVVFLSSHNLPCFFLHCSLGLLISLLSMFFVGIFVSSSLGATLFELGEWFIKRMLFVKYIYSASK